MASSARLDELKKKFEENPRRYFAPLANEHRKSGDLDQAIALCRTHLPQQPGHISGHIVLAQALFEAGSLDESREIFHSALGLDPENLIALRYLGDIAKEARDLDTARSWYQRVLEVDPRNEEIEQLVRDLDAPPPAVEQTSVAEVAAENDVAAAASSFAPPATASSPPLPVQPAEPEPAELDARFAPLSIEEVEIDDSFGVPAPEAQPNDAATQPHAHAPLIDAPEIDQFDLDPSGSVDALLESPPSQTAEEFFLTELSGAHATADGAEPDGQAPESWVPPDAHVESVAAQAATEDLSTLDDAAFQLEPPPAEPVASADDDVDSNAEPEPAAEAPESKDQIAIPGMDAFAAEYSTGSYEAIPEPAPNDGAIEQLASQQTAEWQPPTPPARAVDDGLGLEVMEFVPPSSEAPAPRAYPEVPDSDPVLGRTLAISTNEPSQPPAAFVTETMAELYLQQGFRNEALTVYRELLSRNPADTSLRDRIDQIESGSISSIGLASVSEDVVESALKRHSGRPPRSVRSFFASLAGRRAPAPREPAHTDSPSEAASPTFDELPSQPNADVPVMPVSAARPARTTPVPSAAETLASFDPFADTGDAEPMSASTLDAAATPNEPFAEFSTGLAAPSRQTPRSMPAQTPPSVFSHSEPQGRPTRAASNELSLDHVFRGAPESAPPADGGFSFDQFFSDSQAGDDAATAAAAPESGRGGGSADAHDIEQFTAWLEGLKKK
jgi:tetratricopeptide (TPR) repeat protein